jgi:hypothetical protein
LATLPSGQVHPEELLNGSFAQLRCEDFSSERNPVRRLVIAAITLGTTLAYPAAALADVVRSSWG